MTKHDLSFLSAAWHEQNNNNIKQRVIAIRED